MTKVFKKKTVVPVVAVTAAALAMLVVAVLSVGCASTPSPARTETIVAAAQVVEAPPPPVSCPDGDQDSVCDSDDRCPMKKGPSNAFGCPIDPCSGDPLLVLVQFDYDSSELPAQEADVQTMDPVLDTVAKAIAQDSSCRVCIVGHASEEGTPDHNEDLSRRRARAVQNFMTHHDLVETRIPATGMGERCQLVPRSSRELNRRVEFRRLKEGEVCPIDCSASGNSL